MILYPAIDIKDGRCVRLLRGDMARVTVYGEDPAAQARHFEAAGCAWLHVVDLDGALAGGARNPEAVRSILASVGIPVQLGGGIRDRVAVESWIEAGVRRVVLGTLAAGDPGFVREVAHAHPGRIAVALDAREGWVAAAGWVEETSLPVREAAARFEGAGVAAIVHTDIGRDGTLAGPNLEASAELAAATEIPVIVSGGVASLGDIERLHGFGVPFEGVIVGRALYEGKIDLGAALARLGGGDA